MPHITWTHVIEGLILIHMFAAAVGFLVKGAGWFENAFSHKIPIHAFDPRDRADDVITTAKMKMMEATKEEAKTLDPLAGGIITSAVNSARAELDEQRKKLAAEHEEMLQWSRSVMEQTEKLEQKTAADLMMAEPYLEYKYKQRTGQKYSSGILPMTAPPPIPHPRVCGKCGSNKIRHDVGTDEYTCFSCGRVASANVFFLKF